MFFILVCSDLIQQAGVRTGYASPVRKAVVIALSGFYLAFVGRWAGGRILSAWRNRDHDRGAAEDQLG